MYIRTVEETYVNKRWGNESVRRRDVFACDQCGLEFQKGYCAAHASSTALTFCSKPCFNTSSSSGALAAKKCAINIERYGVAYGGQVKGAAEKMVATRLERYGTAAPVHEHEEISAKFKASMLDRHGVDSPLKSPVLRKKQSRTCKERYGVENTLSKGSKFRCHEDHVKGGQHGYRALIKKHGDVMLSKPEALMAQLLCDSYGSNAVKQQVPVKHSEPKHWLIDFYVKSIDTYIEVDGVFWHGLDRPYEQLHPQARTKYDRDRVQDAWFAGNGKKLVRVTDQQLIQCQKKSDFSDILEVLGG